MMPHGPIRWYHMSIFATWQQASKRCRPMSNWHVSHVPRGSPAHSHRNFPGDTVWSSKSQTEQSCGLERQKKKKALLRNKKPGFHTWNRGNTKIIDLTWQTYFFTIYHSHVADSGSLNVDCPIDNCHMSACHVSTYSRPVRNFFSQISHIIGGPSNQSSVSVDCLIKVCHVSMCHVSIYSRRINGTNQSAIDTWHAKLQHDV
jgi:hypothetical protein